MAEIEIVLPAVTRAPIRFPTDAGNLTLPGRDLPERRVRVDPDRLAALRDAARKAASHAHAPYSRFPVGAALVMADDPQDRIFTGCNVENATTGATICAERNAIASAVAAGFRRIRAVAVSCRDALHLELAQRGPCGICRQTIAEFAGRDPETLVLIDTVDPDGLGDILDLDRLLPYPFTLR